MDFWHKSAEKFEALWYEAQEAEIKNLAEVSAKLMDYEQGLNQTLMKAELATANERVKAYREVAEELATNGTWSFSDEEGPKRKEWYEAKAKLEALNNQQ